MLYLLERSLTSESTYDYLRGLAAQPVVKLIILALAWAYLHHFLAGIRHLFMDMHYLLSKDGSRNSAVTRAGPEPVPDPAGRPETVWSVLNHGDRT